MTFQTLSSIAGNLRLPSFGASTLSNCVLVFHSKIVFLHDCVFVALLSTRDYNVFLIALVLFLKSDYFNDYVHKTGKGRSSLYGQINKYPQD